MSRDYFTVEHTSLTIPKRGALAIYCGDRPTKNADGSTTHSLRVPLFLIPEDIVGNAEEIAREVSAILNAHADRFFASAKEGDEHA